MAEAKIRITGGEGQILMEISEEEYKDMVKCYKARKEYRERDNTHKRKEKDAQYMSNEVIMGNNPEITKFLKDKLKFTGKVQDKVSFKVLYDLYMTEGRQVISLKEFSDIVVSIVDRGHTLIAGVKRVSLRE